MARKPLSEIKRPTKAHVIEALEGAHREIRKRGWAQGEFVTTEGRVCFFGGLGAALSASSVLDDPHAPLWERGAAVDARLRSAEPLTSAVERAMAATVGVAPRNIAEEWNDDFDRTKAQVLRAITRTIKRLRG